MFLRKAGKGVVAGVRARGEDHSCMCDARAVAEEVAEVVVRAKNLLVEAGVVRACTDVGAQVHATVIVASLLWTEAVVSDRLWQSQRQRMVGEEVPMAQEEVLGPNANKIFQLLQAWANIP